MGLGLHSKLGDKYERVDSDNVCLGFTLSRSRAESYHKTINCFRGKTTEMKIRNTSGYMKVFSFDSSFIMLYRKTHFILVSACP